MTDLTHDFDGRGSANVEGLTRDNPHLSRPTIAADDALIEPPLRIAELMVDAHLRAINCTSGLASEIEAYVQAGVAPATRRAYRADLDHFHAWGGDIPATDERLAAYLAAYASLLSVATLTRRLAAISVAHDAHSHSNPVRSPLVRATMRGIRRAHGGPQRQTRPLLRDDLFAVLAATGDRLKDIRDRALLLIGFAGGFRRSELVALDLGDVELVRQGIVVTLRRSKTDQDGVGRKVGIPLGRSKWCPVAALESWLAAADIQGGAVFRRVDRHGRVSTERLSGEAVSLVVRGRIAAAGMNLASYSGHSLRAGFATSAAQAGVATWRIRRQTGHASDAMLARYIRDGELFLDNAAGALL